MPDAIDPRKVLERLQSLSLASPDDVRFQRAIDWLQNLIASKREDVAA